MTPAQYPGYKAGQEAAARLPSDIAKETNPQIQAGKVRVAAAEGQARANIEAQTLRGYNAAVANVPPHLVAPASAAASKAGEDYANSKSISDRMAAMMTEAAEAMSSPTR